MPEMLKVCLGIAAIILGGLLLGLLVWIRVLTEKLAPLWIWIFSLVVIAGGVCSVIMTM